MSILVTGGAGYIGSHTVRKLTDIGYNVIVYDSLEKSHKESVKDIPLIVGNILDEQLLDSTMKKYNIQSVIHFAAYSLVGESMAEPEKYYVNNVCGTVNLLKVMLNNNIKRIVFSSTAAVYGEPQEIPITENSPKNPTNVYGKTKLMIEEILKDYDLAYGLKYISLRYFNACGADESGEIGEDHTPETHLMPLVLQSALGKLPEIRIFGTDYPTPDGTCIRDYIHVNDLAEAHILALEKLLADGQSAVYNLGNGNGFSVREVIRAAEEVVGKPIKVVEGERRPGDPAVLVASAEKIKRELGWQPKYQGLKEIIETAWKWHQLHPNGYNTNENF
ncbi:UDP-glucose 4-epimerase GalE [Thermanaerosceptrum fracticalcis]|uniref:UDP-glucose 4-epimerase n=1 Tax=Thermanaerosceptrum fracticalcis TaxID=1712410 RepID=A0A7G6E4T9_THEFR|nr:UDP-glucose 4-epimerase GalE [Thermanaerosceptrum fracticalcis]QNB47093.1 UDP-glucose 4-epimerase GalE [Thermanaerosceptrum fracticalcis]